VPSFPNHATREGIVRGTQEARGWRSTFQTFSTASLFAPLAVTGYAIVGAFWQTLLVGAQGENCAVSTRDPWEGVALLSVVACVVLFAAGAFAIFELQMRREGLQLVLSGGLLLLAVGLLVAVAASYGYLSC
jgi:hypothetical protein